MASSIDSSTGLDATPLTSADPLQAVVQAAASSTASGRTIEGDAGADAVVTQAVAALDSPIVVGGQARLDVVQDGRIVAEALTVNGSSSSASALFDNGSSGGPSPAGQFGGILDTTGNATDITVAGAADLTVRVDNSASATATGTAGAASARSVLPGSDGLRAIATEIGASGTVRVGVDADLTAIATTVGSGPAATVLAEVSGLRVAGIAPDADSGDPSTLRFGGQGTLVSTAGSAADPVTLTARAASQAGDSSASAQLAELLGARLGTLESGAALSLTAGVESAIEATASSGEGAVQATAGLGSAQGATLSSGASGGNAAIQADATARLRADAANVGAAAAPANASADLPGWVVGLEAAGPFSSGGSAGITARGDLQAEARAGSIAGAAGAAAGADMADVRGFTNITSFDPISVGGNLNLQGSAATVLRATAATVGAAGTPAPASAEVGGRAATNWDRIGNVALEFSAGDLNVGGAASVNGVASLQNSASARSTQGDVMAAALSDRNLGLQSNSVISIGSDLQIRAAADQIGSAEANTVQGTSRAQMATATNAAVYEAPPPSPPAPIRVGSSLNLEARSQVQGQASASSIDAGQGQAVSADVSHDLVDGVNLAGASLQVGRAASLQAVAASQQRATASNVGPAASDAQVSATAAGSDHITALQGLSLSVGGDLNRLTAGAQLDAQASSSNGGASGLSRAEVGADGSGNGTLVRGIYGVDISIGGSSDPVAGIAATADTQLRASARGIAGEVRAASGDADSATIGVDASSLQSGDSALLISRAGSQLWAQSETVAADSSSSAAQSTIGLRQVQLDVADGLNLSGIAAFSGTVLASTTLGHADASLTQTTQGIAANDISVGADSLITAKGSSYASSTSHSIQGSV